MNLIKKLTFDNNTLGTLSALDWSDDGTQAKIINQLDRPAYMKVNKALEAMGGKWNRSAKAHIFKLDPRSSVEGLLSSGILEVEKEGFFETPEHIVEHMIDTVPFIPEHYILEPSAGLGAIIRVLLSRGAIEQNIFAIEKNQQRAGELLSKYDRIGIYTDDFMNHTAKFAYDRVYMNPPFELQQDIDHVKKAYGYLGENGALVAIMAASAFFRENFKSVEFRKWVESVGGNYEKLPDGSFKESGTMVNTYILEIRK